MKVTRRDAMALSGAAVLAPRTALGAAGSALYVPGYDVDDVQIDGVPARAHPVAARALPPDYGGPLTLLTRIDLSTGEARHAVLPVQGHVVAVDRAAGRGVLHAQSSDWLVAFDPETLDVLGPSDRFADRFVGGGHATFVRGGDLLLTVERAPYGPRLDEPQRHFGRVTIRDPGTLAEIGRVSTHGIAPHDLALLDDGSTLVVANYGSTRPRECRPVEALVEPSLTFVDLDSGRLLDKVTTGSETREIRHVAAAGRDRLLAVQVDQGTPEALEAALGEPGADDRTRIGACEFLPAPLLSLNGVHRGAPPSLVEATNPALMRHGLSIVHDPVHDEFLASFPSSHAVMVIEGATGRVDRAIDTAALGLAYPSGVALDPARGRWFVAGAFGPIRAFETGSHAALPQAGIDIALHRHSHMVVA